MPTTAAPVDAGRLDATEEARLWQALGELTDPEIPVVTLREMGIVRALRRAADGQVEVVITPTYSGCPAMDQIADDIAALLAREGVPGRVVTQLAPAWTTDWMTPAAHEKLRAYGIAPPRRGATGVTVSTVRFTPKSGATGASSMRSKGQFYSQSGIPCPQCGSVNTTETSPFGSTACKALYRCLDCLEPFDYFKPL